MDLNVEVDLSSYDTNAHIRRQSRNVRISSSEENVPRCFGEFSSMLLTQNPYPMLITGSKDGLLNVYG